MAAMMFADIPFLLAGFIRCSSCTVAFAYQRQLWWQASLWYHWSDRGPQISYVMLGRSAKPPKDRQCRTSMYINNFLHVIYESERHWATRSVPGWTIVTTRFLKPSLSTICSICLPSFPTWSPIIHTQWRTVRALFTDGAWTVRLLDCSITDHWACWCLSMTPLKDYHRFRWRSSMSKFAGSYHLWKICGLCLSAALRLTRW